MMIITDATQDLQLLSNIGDMAVAGTAVSGTAVDHCSVVVSLGETDILDEDLYSDEDGTVWVRDVKSLLLPYMTPAAVTSFTITVDDVESTLSVMYATGIVKKPIDAQNVDFLRSIFLISSHKKRVCIGSPETLPIFGNYSSTFNVTLNVYAVYSNGDVPTSTVVQIVVPFEQNQAVKYADVSPSQIITLIAASGVIGTIHLYGYKVEKIYQDFVSNVVYSVIPSSTLTVMYRNPYGCLETNSAVGNTKIQRDYDLQTSYIGGNLRRQQSELIKTSTFSMPLVTESDNEIAESILSSEDVQLYIEGQWEDITITGYEHETDNELSAANTISYSYQKSNRQHRNLYPQVVEDPSITAYGGYEIKGLLMQLDCAQNIVGTNWTDLIGGKVATLSNITSATADGVVLTSGSSVTLPTIEGAVYWEVTTLNATTEEAQTAYPTTSPSPYSTAGTLYAIRAYNRTLDATEKAKNAAIDKARFGYPSNAIWLQGGTDAVCLQGGDFICLSNN